MERIKRNWILTVFLIVMIVVVPGCQKREQRRPTEQMEAALEQQSAMLENEMPDGILIVYQPEEESLVQTAELIQAVTAGTKSELQGDGVDLKSYGTIFLGFSAQGAELPEAVHSFLEEEELENKTVIPFYHGKPEWQQDYKRQILEMIPNIELLETYYIHREQLEDTVQIWLSDMGYHE